MARIVGVAIPRNKKGPFSLWYIHGIGLTTAKKLFHSIIDEFELSISLGYKKYDAWTHILDQKIRILKINVNPIFCEKMNFLIKKYELA